MPYNPPKQPLENPMKDKRIDFFGRWGMAFFAVLVVLAGWLGNSINAGKFGIMFWPGVAGMVIFAALSLACTLASLHLINQPEESKNE